MSTTTSTTIKLNVKQFEILKCLHHACSDDTYRATLQHVYYDHKKKQFVATDGHILRSESWDYVFDDRKAPDFSFYLKKTAFINTIAQFKKLYTVKSDEKIANYEFNVSSDVSEIGIYPDYPKVYENKEKKAVERIGFDLDLLSRLRKTFPKSKDCNIKFEFTGELSACLFSATNGDFTREAGVIMPIRLFD